MKKIMLLVCLVLVSMLALDSFGAARWEKKAKLSGYYDGTDTGSTIRAGFDSAFVRRGVASTWANECKFNYDATTSGGINAWSYLIVAETYQKNISAFTFWKFYLGVSDWGLSGNLYSESTLTAGKVFSRYFNGSIGAKVKKMVVPDGAATTQLRVEMLFDKPLGYRTKLTFAPALNFDTDNMSNFDIQSNLVLSYKFGKRISFELTAEPGYNSQTQNLSGRTLLNLVYDFFMY